MAGTPERMRHFSLYYKGKKYAEMQSQTYSIPTNDERQIADGGYMGHSDGQTVTDLSVNAIVMVGGSSITALQDMIRKQYVDIGLGIVDGKIHRIKMRCTQAEYEGEATNGTQKVRWQFEGGEPNTTG